MPKLLTEGMGSGKERIVQLLEEATEKNWRKNIGKALTVLKQQSFS